MNYKEETDIRDLVEKAGGKLEFLTMLPGSGSARRYWRVKMTGGSMAIASWGPDVSENKAFIGLSGYFREAGVKVPGILAVSEEGHWYLQTDLGDENLLSRLGSAEGFSLAQRAMKELARLQFGTGRGWEKRVAFPDFGCRLIMWDLNYFKYEFLKPLGIVFDEEKLEDEFEAFASRLLGTDRRTWGFMYRDCQSRNVMVKDGELWWIDYQGGRVGPGVYDAVSFAWQSKAGFTASERDTLINAYSESVGKIIGEEPTIISREAGHFALFRTLQVLGAYGLRGLVERKSHFLESIPGALSNLRELLEEGVADEYPEMKRVCRRCVGSRYAYRPCRDGLTVTVFSFSYKKGYPEDLSGNGGGFMFDCRGMHNPGRYEEYKPLTGLDKPVRDFLEERGEVQVFVRGAVEMTEKSVARYRDRGFTSLQVGFGCTGGRHRSVYCAQAYAEALAEKFPEIKIRLVHREQGIEQDFGKEGKK